MNDPLSPNWTVDTDESHSRVVCRAAGRSGSLNRRGVLRRPVWSIGVRQMAVIIRRGGVAKPWESKNHLHRALLEQDRDSRKC